MAAQPCEGVPALDDFAVSLLDGVSQKAILIDPAKPGFPIVSVSTGYLTSSGHDRQHFLGQGVDILTKEVHACMKSKSAMLDQHNFLALCGGDHEVADMLSESRVVQMVARKDGVVYPLMGFYGISVLKQKRYVLGSLVELAPSAGERISAARMEDAEEEGRAAFRQLRYALRKKVMGLRQVSPGRFASNSSFASDCSEDAEANLTQRKLDPMSQHTAGSHRRDELLAVGGQEAPFNFFNERMQHHCILTNDSKTVERREADELPTNCCTVFSQRPLAFAKVGLTFRVQVDKTAGFRGLPFLGITRREPEDRRDLYPTMAKCCGASAVAGGGGEAYARDQDSHFKLLYKQPAQSEVQTLLSPPRGAAVPSCKEGDVLTLTYTWAGRLQLHRNEEAVVDVDTGRPLDTGCVHYAMIDVCFSAAKLSVLPNVADLEQPSTPSKEREMVETLVRDIKHCAVSRAACSQTLGSIATTVPNEDLDGAETNSEWPGLFRMISPSVLSEEGEKEEKAAGARKAAGSKHGGVEDYSTASSDRYLSAEACRARSCASSAAPRRAGPEDADSHMKLTYTTAAMIALPCFAVGLAMGAMRRFRGCH